MWYVLKLLTRNHTFLAANLPHLSASMSHRPTSFISQPQSFTDLCRYSFPIWLSIGGWVSWCGWWHRPNDRDGIPVKRNGHPSQYWAVHHVPLNFDLRSWPSCLTYTVRGPVNMGAKYLSQRSFCSTVMSAHTHTHTQTTQLTKCWTRPLQHSCKYRFWNKKHKNMLLYFNKNHLKHRIKTSPTSVLSLAIWD